MTKLGAGAGSENDWGKLPDPDPHWNQCGPETSVVDPDPVAP
jgi:hypothetical protein